jgi:hypothetical protein
MKACRPRWTLPNGLRLNRLDRPVLPIIVQATGDGEADVTRTEVMTCDNASDGAFIPTTSATRCKYLPHFGLYHVHGEPRRYF